MGFWSTTHPAILFSLQRLFSSLLFGGAGLPAAASQVASSGFDANRVGLRLPLISPAIAPAARQGSTASAWPNRFRGSSSPRGRIAAAVFPSLASSSPGFAPGSSIRPPTTLG